MTEVCTYSSSSPSQPDAFASSAFFYSHQGPPSSPFTPGDEDLDVDASFASSISITSNADNAGSRYHSSPSTSGGTTTGAGSATAGSASVHYLPSPSPAHTHRRGLDQSFVFPSVPKPDQLDSSSLGRSSGGPLFKKPSPRLAEGGAFSSRPSPLFPSSSASAFISGSSSSSSSSAASSSSHTGFGRARSETNPGRRPLALPSQGGRRAFGTELSANTDSPISASRGGGSVHGPSTAKKLGSTMCSLPLPKASSLSAESPSAKAAIGGAGAGSTKSRPTFPAQWKAVNMGGGFGADLRRGGKFFTAINNRDSASEDNDSPSPLNPFHETPSRRRRSIAADSPLARRFDDMDVDGDDDDATSGSALLSMPPSPAFSTGSDLADFFHGSPSTAPATKTLFGDLTRSNASSPPSSPSSDRPPSLNFGTSSSTSSRPTSSSGSGNLFTSRAFERTATACGPPLSSAGPRAATLTSASSSSSSSRRQHPYPKRPLLSAMQNPATLIDDAPPQQSAYPIMSSASPSASASPLVSTTTFPRSQMSMRRAYSVSTDAAHFVAGIAGSPIPRHHETRRSADESCGESPCRESPAAVAQRDYARRHNARLVRLADGSPAFRPAHEGGGDDGGDEDMMMRSPERKVPAPMLGCVGSPSTYMPLGGFGDSEAAGKILPCKSVKDDGLMRISAATLRDLINGRYASRVRAYHIVDCRFEYEYAGGHIQGAVNLRNEGEVAEFLLTAGKGIHEDGSSPPLPSTSGRVDADGEMAKTIIIFHCEFSKKRGPETAKELRKADRATNTRSYPALHYPEVYILEGGYCEFFKKQPDSCCPRAYVPMDDPAHNVKRSSHIHEFRTRKFARAQSWQGEIGGMFDGPSSQATTVPARPRSSGIPPSLAFAAGSIARDKRRPAIAEEEEHDSSFSSSVGDSPIQLVGGPSAGSRREPFKPVQPLLLRPRAALDRAASSPFLPLGGGPAAPA